MSTDVTSSYSHIFMRFSLIGCAALLLVVLSCHNGSKAPAEDYDEARVRMVRNQIEARGIEDERVLEAMLAVRRHEFIPEQYRHYAYHDSPVPIGYGQTISQPYIVALMTQELSLSTADRVLEVGTGSGYQAAVLSKIVDEVYTIEIVEPLGREAEERLKRLGYDNVKVKIGDGYEGWEEYAPYDRVIVTCAPTDIPDPLIDQMKEGGIMVIPMGSAGFQYLYRVKKYMGEGQMERVIPVSFVPLTGPHAE
jgi:protein-L-isoaspartate(D-aspartate) O-methyltransferase